MKLKKVHIRDFQSIHDSGEFDTGDITCLVGKNEAGKTALLQALYRLNPIVPSESKYSVTDDYPRWDVEDYRHAVEKGQRKPATVVQTTFELQDDDVEPVTREFGPQALTSRSLKISKGYDGTPNFTLEVNEGAVLEYLVSQKEFTPDVTARLQDSHTLKDASDVLSTAEKTESVKQLDLILTAVKKSQTLDKYIYEKFLFPRVPKFLYFDEFYQMIGRANVEALKQRKAQEKLLRSDHPLLGLINLARLDLDQLHSPARTRDLKNSLEGAGNHLTKRVVKYWSQNRYLQLRFDVRHPRTQDPEGMTSGTNIWGEIYDAKHMVTTELGTRSRGFVWFFSFLAWYSDLRQQQDRLILLLDEPGLSLHAKAQEDLRTISRPR